MKCVLFVLNDNLLIANQLEEEERKLYLNNLLHIHQHTFFKYMMQSIIEGKNQKTNMPVYDTPTPFDIFVVI